MKLSNIFRNWLIPCSLAFSLAISGQGFADEVEDQEESDFHGVIDAVDLSKRTIVINDWVYNLSLALKVHDGDKLGTDFALREKVPVTFEIDPKTADQAVQTITDVWLQR